LSTEDALVALSLHRDLHPELHRRSAELAGALAAKNVDIYGLLAMTPFGKDETGAWGDVVQGGVTGGLGTIMNSFIPGDLWSRLFPGIPQPTLTGQLAEVAGSPAYGLADGSEDHCRYLNGPRAMTWLKTQIATSPVYHAHGQRLFGIEWQKHCPMTADYLADQITNAQAYQATIDAAVKADIDLTGATLIDFSLADCKIANVSFRSTTFTGIAKFSGAEFGGDANFDRAEFGGDARFGEAEFGGVAGFDEAMYDGRVFDPAEHGVPQRTDEPDPAGDPHPT
jgi:hypothetical protein